MSNLSPFQEDNLPTTKQETALVEVAAQREVAEVQAAMIIARKFPRNQAQSMDRILIACQRPALAEGALYSYAKGGTDITGPSIRLAEAIAQNWGNIQFGIRELEQRYGESTVEAYSWDLETNTRQTKVFQVRHIRHTKKGTYKLEDPREIYELVANQGARRMRACILGVIPGDVVEAAVAQCEQTMKAKADTSPEALQKMVKAFGEFGITKEMIEKRIQRKIESITPAQVIGLRKIYNSLKDGMSTAADWFEVGPPPESGEDKPQGDRIKEELSKRRGRPIKDAPQASETPQEAPPAESQGEGHAQEEIPVTVSVFTIQGIIPETKAKVLDAAEATGLNWSPVLYGAGEPTDLPIDQWTEDLGQKVLEWYRSK